MDRRVFLKILALSGLGAGCGNIERVGDSVYYTEKEPEVRYNGDPSVVKQVDCTEEELVADLVSLAETEQNRDAFLFIPDEGRVIEIGYDSPTVVGDLNNHDEWVVDVRESSSFLRHYMKRHASLVSYQYMLNPDVLIGLSLAQNPNQDADVDRVRADIALSSVLPSAKEIAWYVNRLLDYEIRAENPVFVHNLVSMFGVASLTATDGFTKRIGFNRALLKHRFSGNSGGELVKDLDRRVAGIVEVCRDAAPSLSSHKGISPSFFDQYVDGISHFLNRYSLSLDFKPHEHLIPNK